MHNLKKSNHLTKVENATLLKLKRARYMREYHAGRNANMSESDKARRREYMREYKRRKPQRQRATPQAKEKYREYMREYMRKRAAAKRAMLAN